MSSNVVIITGASTGFGALTARLLSRAGYIVYAGMRSHEPNEIAAAHAFAETHNVALRTVILDVVNKESVEVASNLVISECGRIDIVVHNAGHGAIGPTEAFPPDQIMQLFEINTLGPQRLNRAVLPHMRKAGQGLIVWVSSSSVRGGTPPFMGPYFAAKAAMDSLAVSYAGELSKWGIETSIIVPGAFTKGTNHFASMSKPADKSIEAEYMEGPYDGVLDQAIKGLSALQPEDADASDVARAILKVVEAPAGKRPFRTHVDPSNDGAEVVNGMADRVRAEMLRRIGLEGLLKPTLN